MKTQHVYLRLSHGKRKYSDHKIRQSLYTGQVVVFVSLAKLRCNILPVCLPCGMRALQFRPTVLSRIMFPLYYLYFYSLSLLCIFVSLIRFDIVTMEDTETLYQTDTLMNKILHMFFAIHGSALAIHGSALVHKICIFRRS